MNEAVILLCRCPEAKRTIGIRTEQVGKKRWEFTWAFLIKEESASRQGYGNTTISGAIGATEDFNGCPLCGARTFIFCSSCGKGYCNHSKNGHTTCPWCGAQGMIQEAETVNLAAGGDR
jgi:DNA-directed RNA polymerase subunit RPC12/RpoP